MAKFVRWTNNGVHAVVTALTFERIRQELNRTGPFRYPVTPVFTFADLVADPTKARFVTGSIEMMNQLLDGHNVETKPFYVPFSNGYEMGHQGEVAQKYEMAFVTTLDDAVRAFNILSRSVSKTEH